MLNQHSTPSKFFECKFSSKSAKVLNWFQIAKTKILDIKSWNIIVKLSTSKSIGVEIFK